MSKLNIPVGCLYLANYVPEIIAEITKCTELCHRYNQLSPTDYDAHQDILRQLVCRVGKNPIVMQPFWCDFDFNVSMGDNFYSNHNLIIVGGAPVTFGDNVFIAPNCCFTTAEHAIDPELRKAGYETAAPITVGNNVWIGAGVTVLAGVTIGDNSVIGAGSVVTKSIPSGVVAVGVPCKVMRPITEADRHTYPMFTE